MTMSKNILHSLRKRAAHGADRIADVSWEG